MLLYLVKMLLLAQQYSQILATFHPATLSFNVNFLTSETTAQDFAFYSISNDSGNDAFLIEDTFNSSLTSSSTRFTDDTGFRTLNISLSPNTTNTTIGFGVLNAQDNSRESGLLLDAPKPVPFEVEGFMGLLALGTFIGSRHLLKARQKRRQTSN